MNGIESWSDRAAARSEMYGLMKEVMAIVDESANNLDTYQRESGVVSHLAIRGWQM